MLSELAEEDSKTIEVFSRHNREVYAVRRAEEEFVLFTHDDLVSFHQCFALAHEQPLGTR
jgi:hypothetical protein